MYSLLDCGVYKLIHVKGKAVKIWISLHYLKCLQWTDKTHKNTLDKLKKCLSANLKTMLLLLKTLPPCSYYQTSVMFLPLIMICLMSLR